MTDAFFEELVILHVYQGAVKQYEVNERRRPKAERFELTEVEKRR